MFLKNPTDDTFSLIDSAGLMTVATPGLSLINGDADDIEHSIKYSQLDLEVLTFEDLSAMPVASFNRLTSGQMTLEALRVLRESKAKLKVGSRNALEAVAA